MNELRDEFGQAMREEAQTRAQTLPGSGAFGGGVLDEAVETTVDERFGWVLPEIADTTKDWVRTDIVDGLDEGKNPRRVAQDLRDRFDEDFATWRAERIARTEMLTASNAGTHAAHQNADVVKKRSWLSTRDGSVRPAHVALDGQVVGVEKPFIIAGEQAMYPGDFPSARLSINCRCTTVAEFDDKRTESERDKIWKLFDKRLTRREQDTKEVARRAFARQRDQVLGVFAQEFDIELEAVA
jgi:SPP1 gp7 family putative phage head morphogenesis protein